jgi:uncharacterized membrane protein
MINPANVFGLLAVFLVLTALAMRLEATRWGSRISGVGFILIFTIAAANFGIIPKSAPLYNTIWTYLVPLAIALFLLKADLLRVLSEGGRVLIAFLAGMAGSALGALLAGLVLDLGPDEASLAAIFGATYTGGSLNFVAVAEAINFDDKSQLAAALAIDSILGVSFIIALNFAAGWAYFKSRFAWRSDALVVTDPEHNVSTDGPVTLYGLVLALALAATIVTLSETLARWAGFEQYSLLLLTVLMTVVATVGRRFVAGLRGEDIIAMIFMYLFFAIIGTGADIAGMLAAAPALFIMVLMIFTTHLVFLLAAGKIFKLNYGELIIASLACIGGPPIASAIAILFKWRNLVIPGILTGILGYIVGNFIGIGLFTILNNITP